MIASGRTQRVMRWVSALALSVAARIALMIVPGAAHAETPPTRPVLAVDKCPPKDRSLSDDELRKRGAEHYRRGETLYLQGDYRGAVSEFVASYCVIPYYSLLKDIGQCFERNLDYEQAILYFERYVEAVPSDAKRSSQCAVDPQEDRENVQRRVRVLRDLRAHIAVETNPPGAQIELVADQRVVSRATSGQPSASNIEVPGRSYEMRIALRGFVPVTKSITVEIGKPYTYVFNLEREKGTVVIQTTPAEARIFLDEKLVGIGRFEGALEAKRYVVAAEQSGHVTERREFDLRAGELKRVSVELAPRPQFGRRQLIGYAAFGGGVATGLMLSPFNQTGITTLGVLAGGAAGLVGTLFYLDDVPLGTSNLTITSSLAGGLLGGFSTSVVTGNLEIIFPIAGATALVGAGVGYYLGNRLHVQPGDGALINSSMTWGSMAGALFALAFGAQRDIGSGLVLSGLAIGGVGGTLMTQYFTISRTHAVLIDVGGVVGIVGGLAIAGLAFPPSKNASGFTDEQAEHFANFSLGGMVVGLIGAGILTRNLDKPNLNLRPTIAVAPTVDGRASTTFGLSGRW